MNRFEEVQAFAIEESAAAAARIVDFAVLAHPLPWDAKLEESVRTTVAEIFETMVAMHDDVRQRLDIDKLREETMAAFRERLATLSRGVVAAGHA